MVALAFPVKHRLTPSRPPLPPQITLAGPSCLGTPDIALNPCTVVAVRQAYATMLGVPLTSMVLQKLDIGTTTYNLASTSPGNLATGTCPDSRT